MAGNNSKRVFITGASAGFGYDTARALAERGHTVYATMRNVDSKNAPKAEALRAWAEGGGHNLHVLELDVTDDESVRSAVGQALELGGIDVLINNAGVGCGGVQETFTIEQVQALFDVNVFGVLRVNRAVLPHLRSKGAGRVVFISSGLGRIVLPFFGPYTATKYAVEALGQTTHYELEPLGIKTVIVQPGAYGTTFMENCMLAADTGRLPGYGPVGGMLEAFVGGFAERAQAGGLPDPAEVVQALIKVTEAPDEELPLRLPVGQDVSEGVAAINGVSDQIQGHVLAAFGLGPQT